MISPERFRIALQLLPPASRAAVALDLMEREMPELFRQVLPSNFSRSAAQPAPSIRQNSTAFAVGGADDDAGCGGPGSPGTPSPSLGRSMGLLHHCDSDESLWQSAPSSPEVSQLHRKSSGKQLMSAKVNCFATTLVCSNMFY